MTIAVFNANRDTAFRPVELDALRDNGVDGLRWIDVVDPSREEIRRLGELFGFHPLALEDVLKGQQRPKVDIYEDYFFVVVYALDPAGSDRRWEIAIFVKRELVVTVRERGVPAFETAIRRFSEHCKEQRSPTSTMLLYTIADSIVDDYFPCMDAIAEEIDQLETGMFDSPDRDELRAIFRMRQRLLAMRRVVSPAREVFNALIRRELPLLGEQSLYYFQDVYDHVIRVTDAIDADRDMLASALDVHLSLAANRMNQTVRTLTAASILLMSLALVAGIYGMNFEVMPELEWRYGYLFALGIMAAIGGALALLFRRLRWW